MEIAYLLTGGGLVLIGMIFGAAVSSHGTKEKATDE